MTADAHLEKYLEGWRRGDGAFSLPTLVPDFWYDDPNSTRIDRNGFVAFVEDFKVAGAEANNGIVPDPFLTYSDVIVDKTGQPHVAWCWWRVTGTKLQGSALIRFDDSGVLSERIAYYSPLPA